MKCVCGYESVNDFIRIEVKGYFIRDVYSPSIVFYSFPKCKTMKMGDD